MIRTFIVAPEDSPEFYVVTETDAEKAALAVWDQGDTWHDYSLFVVDITGFTGVQDIGNFDNKMFDWIDYSDRY